MSITAAGAAATVTGFEAELEGVDCVAACVSTERAAEVSIICADVISVSIGSVAANVAHGRQNRAGRSALTIDLSMISPAARLNSRRRGGSLQDGVVDRCGDSEGGGG